MQISYVLSVVITAMRTKSWFRDFKYIIATIIDKDQADSCPGCGLCGSNGGVEKEIKKKPRVMDSGVAFARGGEAGSWRKVWSTKW